STYTLVSGDAGSTIRVRETASKSNYQSVSQYSGQSAVVDQIVNTAAPTISGTASVGNSLSAAGGSWTPAGTSSSYQWRQCDSSGSSCADIGGATGTSYTVVAGDQGRSEEHSLNSSHGSISYAVFCWKKKTT